LRSFARLPELRDRRLCRPRGCADLGLVRLPHKGSAGCRSAQSELIVEPRAGAATALGPRRLRHRGREDLRSWTYGSPYRQRVRVRLPCRARRSASPKSARRLKTMRPDAASGTRGLCRPHASETPAWQGDLPECRHNPEVGTIGVVPTAQRRFWCTSSTRPPRGARTICTASKSRSHSRVESNRINHRRQTSRARRLHFGSRRGATLVAIGRRPRGGRTPQTH
jgi:hypothetical protein